MSIQILWPLFIYLGHLFLLLKYVNSLYILGISINPLSEERFANIFSNFNQ